MDAGRVVSAGQVLWTDSYPVSVYQLVRLYRTLSSFHCWIRQYLRARGQYLQFMRTCVCRNDKNDHRPPRLLCPLSGRMRRGNGPLVDRRSFARTCPYRVKVNLIFNFLIYLYFIINSDYPSLGLRNVVLRETCWVVIYLHWIIISNLCYSCYDVNFS